jgi:hypothetical protein
MRKWGGLEVELHTLFYIALEGGEWSASQTGHLTAGERAQGMDWIGWVGSTARHCG